MGERSKDQVFVTELPVVGWGLIDYHNTEIDSKFSEVDMLVVNDSDTIPHVWSIRILESDDREIEFASFPPGKDITSEDYEGMRELMSTQQVS